MNEMQIFSYGSAQLRTVELDGEMWWVLRDVCDILGIVKPDRVASRLDADEKGTHLMSTPYGNQNMTIINEPGLYNVILRSDKPEAKDFKRWVTHEVLPSIRNRGSYRADQPMTPAQLLAAQAQVLVEMEKRVDAVQAETKALSEKMQADAKALSEKVQADTQALSDKLDNAVRVFARPDEDHWKDDMNRAIKAMCDQNNSSVPRLKGKMYAELERTVNCDIDSRLRRLRQRVRRAGGRRCDAMALSKMDVVAMDRNLRAVFEGIVRSWQSKFAVLDDVEIV